MKHSKSISFIVITFIFMLLIGCGNNEYNDFVQKYDQIYFELAKSVDIKDTIKTLKNMQEGKNIELINELQNLIDTIEDEVPKNAEKHFDMLRSQYEGLILIKESYTKWDKMTPEEKGKVLAAIDYIEMRKIDKMQESNK